MSRSILPSFIQQYIYGRILLPSFIQQYIYGRILLPSFIQQYMYGRILLPSSFIQQYLNDIVLPSLSLLMTELTLQPYDWKVLDQPDHLSILIWCLNRESQWHLVRIDDYPASLYVQLPFYINDTKMAWTSGPGITRIDQLQEDLRQQFGPNCPTVNFVRRKPLYYYTPYTRPFLLLTFKTLKVMYQSIEFLRKNKTCGEIKIYEDDISTDRKLLSRLGLNYSQWFWALGNKPESPLSKRLDREYVVSYKEIKPLSPDVTDQWFTYPAILSWDIEVYSDNHDAFPERTYAPCVAYMISCIYQRFRQPETRKRYVILYGDCHEIEGTDDIIKVENEVELIYAFGKLVEKLDPDIMTGYNIIGFDYGYLDARLRLFGKKWPESFSRLDRTNPELWHSEWNSSGAGINNIDMLMIPGRISIDLYPLIKRDHKLDKYTLDHVSRHFLRPSRGKHDIKPKEMFQIYKMWMDIAARNEEIEKADIEQRMLSEKEYLPVAYDLYHKISKESNSFNEWYQQFWNDILDREKQLFENYDPDSFKHKVSKYTDDLEREMPHITKEFDNRRSNLSKMTNEFFDLLNKELQKLKKENPDRFDECATKLVECKKNKERQIGILMASPEVQEAKEGMTRITRYCIQDAELVTDLFDTLNSWFSLIEMSNVVGVKMVDLFTRGQQVRFLNLIYDKCYHRGFVLTHRMGVKLPYKGAFVNDPVPGYHDNVLCLDFSSMYPYTIIAHNICFTTLVPKEKNGEIADDQCFVNEGQTILGDGGDNDDSDSDSEGDKPAKSTVPYKDKFVKEHLAKGLLPEIEQVLISSRSETRKRISQLSSQLKTITDPNEKASIQLMLELLDRRQWALKICANSLYGALGVGDGRLPLLEGARFITDRGRELIGIVNDYLINKYQARIIYNDTDSSMFSLGLKDPKECDQWGNRLAQEISGISKGEKKWDGTVAEIDEPGLLPPPMKITFEKAMIVFFLKKKNYVYWYIKKDGTIKRDDHGKIITETKGLVGARREHCQYLKRVYADLMDIVMHRGSLYDATQCIVKHINNLLFGRVAIKDLIMIREVGTYGPKSTYYMKLFVEDMARIGRPVAPGDRIEYFIAIKPGETKMGHKIVSLDHYKEMKEEERPCPDLYYYVANQLQKKLDALFTVAYRDELQRLSNVVLTRKHPKRTIGLWGSCIRDGKEVWQGNLVKIIAAMIEDGILIKSLLAVIPE